MSLFGKQHWGKTHEVAQQALTATGTVDRTVRICPSCTAIMTQKNTQHQNPHRNNLFFLASLWRSQFHWICLSPAVIWRMGLAGGELPEAHSCSRSLTAAAEQPQMSLFVKKDKEMGKRSISMDQKFQQMQVAEFMRYHMLCKSWALQSNFIRKIL